MFERYTEKARRVIFFARYEASQFGAPSIEPEHLLLGLLREDKTLTARFLARAHATVDSIRKEVENRSPLRDKISATVELPLALDTKRVLHFAHEESDRLQHRHIGTEHLLLGLLREDRSAAAEILLERGLRLASVRDEIARATGDSRSRDKKDTPHLSEFSRDLTEDAAADRLDPLVGRETEIERVVQILCRRTKNNPVLIGEPGVGKTAIVEGLAQRIVRREVPSFLEGKRVLSLDLSLIVAGTKYRGQFEERLKQIMRELVENPHYIIFIDELHTLVGAGSAEGSLDAANILKPALSRGELQCIGATTPAEFRRSIEKDRSLERRFQSVKVPPPSEEEAVRVLEGVRERYEAFHRVRYTDEALEAAVYQSSRYIPDRFLPDKAIDVIDEAGSRVKLRANAADDFAIAYREEIAKTVRRPIDDKFMPPEPEEDEMLSFTEVGKDDIEEVIARWTGIPVMSLKEEETHKLLRIELELHRRIIAQRPAISALARAIRRSRAGLKNPSRPVGSFLFLGPTGVGKTEVARVLAEFLFGSERALIRFDMSELMEKHAVSKLIGSPPGYIGHEEGGQLTGRIKRAPYSVVLFDEIEKAHPDIFNVLLQVFEDGHLTDALGNTVDFKNTIIIMTSNIGARFIQKRGTLGFQATADKSRGRVEEMVMSAVRQTFNPEFINRLDEIIIFDELGDEELLEIVGLQIESLNRILRRRDLEITLTDEAKLWLVRKTCADRSYGARPLRRALQRYVEDPLSEAIIQGEFAGTQAIEIFLEDDELRSRPAVSDTLEDAGDAVLMH